MGLGFPTLSRAGAGDYWVFRDLERLLDRRRGPPPAPFASPSLRLPHAGATLGFSTQREATADSPGGFWGDIPAVGRPLPEGL